MRPGVVWFGEQLDPLKLARVETFLERGPCDAVLVIGTTAMFGYIVDWALRACNDATQLIEINPAPTELSRWAKRTLREPAGKAVPKLVEEILA